jgi:hypothetical protein
MGRNSFLAGVIAFVMIALFLSCFGVFANGQSETVFTQTDTFKIPVNNSTIIFAVNGTYEQASLENGTWSFVNLRLINSQNSENLDLKVSAKDSKVTIVSCQIYNGTFAGERARGARLRYTVVGRGVQVFYLGIDPKGGDWGVNFNGIYMGKNDGWHLSPDGTLTVTGATANVTLIYYGFPDSFREGEANFNQSILKQHSIVIVTTIAAAIIIILAVATRTRKTEATKLDSENRKASNKAQTKAHDGN